MPPGRRSRVRFAAPTFNYIIPIPLDPPLGLYWYHPRFHPGVVQISPAEIEVIRPVVNLNAAQPMDLAAHAFHLRNRWVRRTPGAEFLLKHRGKGLPVIAEQKSSGTKLSFALKDSKRTSLR